MTKADWATLLASLQHHEEERRRALLELSDEDWLSEEGREVLRAGAEQEHCLRPADSRGDDYPTTDKEGHHFYWVTEDFLKGGRSFLVKNMWIDGLVGYEDRYPNERGTLLPAAVADRLPWHDQDAYRRCLPTAPAAWLSLLEALSGGC